MAKAASLKALELDDSLAVAHAALACVHWFYDWDLAACEKEILRAHELNPGEAHLWYAAFLCVVKEDYERGLAEVRKAEELDPLSQLVHLIAGWEYIWADQYERAIEQARKALEIYPDMANAWVILAVASVWKGFVEEGIAAAEKATLISRNSFTLAILGFLNAHAGREDKAKTLLSELHERAEREYVLPFFVAYVHAGLGDKDEAFRWLEKAYQERLGALFWLKVTPPFDGLHGDPRFQDLVRRLGLPP